MYDGDGDDDDGGVLFEPLTAGPYAFLYPVAVSVAVPVRSRISAAARLRVSPAPPRKPSFLHILGHP